LRILKLTFRLLLNNDQYFLYFYYFFLYRVIEKTTEKLQIYDNIA